jgi:hypothetical protein
MAAIMELLVRRLFLHTSVSHSPRKLAILGPFEVSAVARSADFLRTS